MSNGFATCTDPARLQGLGDRLGPGDIDAFFDRWMSVLPVPLTDADRAARPTGGSCRCGRSKPPAPSCSTHHATPAASSRPLVVDNLDIGRPDRIEVTFAGHPHRWGRPPTVELTYKTRMATRDTIGVTVNADYKHSRIKQYIKDGRALRIETVINDRSDLICKRRLPHLPELQAKARAVNARLLDTERVGQGVLASAAFERVAQSTLTEDGRRSPALRVGDPRVMALLGALAQAGEILNKMAAGRSDLVAQEAG